MSGSTSGLSARTKLELSEGHFKWGRLASCTSRTPAGKTVTGKTVLFRLDVEITDELLDKLKQLRIQNCTDVILDARFENKRVICVVFKGSTDENLMITLAHMWRTKANACLELALRSATPTQPAAQRTPRKTRTSTTSTTPANVAKDEVASAQAVSFSHPKPGPRK